MTRNITHFGETGRPNSIIGAVPLRRTAQKHVKGGGLLYRSAQITDKADSKVGFLHFQAIIAKKLEVGEGLS